MRARACLIALTLVATTAGAAPPSVDVRFVIEAKQFVDGLGKSRQSVERAITQTLLDECRDQKSFPFLGWMNGDATAPNRLVVALTERRAGADFETLIEYRGTTRKGNMAPALQEVVYRWYEAKNVDSAEIVKARLQKKIREQFANDTFRQNLLQYFVSRVPLADSAFLQGHQVVVPVPSANLYADERKSELMVSFFGMDTGDQGSMTLNQPYDYPQKSGVRCQIEDFTFADIPRTKGWNDRIPHVFGPSKVRDVTVMMSKYVPSYVLGSRQGSVTSD